MGLLHDQLREAKVRNLCSHLLVQQDVARLDVAVDDGRRAPAVKVFYPFR